MLGVVREGRDAWAIGAHAHTLFWPGIPPEALFELAVNTAVALGHISG